KKLEGWVKQRRANALALTKGIEGIDGLVPPSEGNWMVHSFYQYIVRREDPFPISRDDIVKILTEDGIGSRPSYPMPLYKQKALHEGHEREHRQGWEQAFDVYSKLLASLPRTSDTESHALRAIALLRSGNALMELRRWDEARRALDEALNEARASEDSPILAQ